MVAIRPPACLAPLHDAPGRSPARLLTAAILLLTPLLAISCGGNTSSDPPAAKINVSPMTVNVGAGEAQQFTASTQSVSGSLTWAVDGVAGGTSATGTISASGFYQAPTTIPDPATITVSAAASGASGSAAATIVPPVAVSPSIVSLTTSQTEQFNAVGPGVTNGSASWAVDGVNGGNSTSGVITASGLYAPPGIAGIHTVTATLIAAPSESATATAAVTAFAGTFSWRNDAGVTGQNRLELAMTPATVKGNFGKLFACPVDGYVSTRNRSTTPI